MLNLHFLKEGQIRCTPLNKPVPLLQVLNLTQKGVFLSLRLLSTGTRVRGQNPSVSDTKISPTLPTQVCLSREQCTMHDMLHALIEKGVYVVRF
jgi:hypothetical protein